MFPAKFFCCLRELLGAAGFTWTGPDVSTGTQFPTSSLAQGSLEDWGAFPDRQNAHSLGGGQRVPPEGALVGESYKLPLENTRLKLKTHKDKKQINPIIYKMPLGEALPRQSQCRDACPVGAHLGQQPAQSPPTSKLNSTPGILVKPPPDACRVMEKPVILEGPGR